MTHYTDQELHEQFDEMLNDCEEPVKCCGMEFEPADVLKTMDPIAYKCSFNDWLSSAIEDEIFFEHSDGEIYDEAEEEEETDEAV